MAKIMFEEPYGRGIQMRLSRRKKDGVADQRKKVK